MRRGVVVLVWTSWVQAAHADQKPSVEPDVDAVARVTVERAAIHTGPSESSRTLLKVERGETFAVDRRGSDQYWLKLELEDGRAGWVLGSDVEVFSVRPDAPKAPSRSRWFAPSSLAKAHGGLALFAGVLGVIRQSPSGNTWSVGDGIVEARPIVVLAPLVSLEPWVAFARTADGTLFHGGAWGVLHLLPRLAIDPYVGLGAGGLLTAPSESALQARDEAFFAGRAGAGVSCGLRGRLLVRLEVSNMTLVSPHRTHHVQTLLAGLGAYF